MGKDKYENETLLKWGWPEDIWFHVDSHSSAHVYLRLKKGETLETLSEKIINECAQLTKANSIEGSKLKSVKIVYTPFQNLKKTDSMDIGQVGYHNDKLQYFITIEKDREIIKNLIKTKEEKYPDLEAERLRRDHEEKKERQKEIVKKRQEEAELEKARKEIKEQKTYKGFFDNSKMKSNKETPEDDDDFM